MTQLNQLSEVLKGNGPVKVTLGDTGVFEQEDKDVVIIHVLSTDLHNLRRKVENAVENTQTFPDYKPHITIAYVKKGKGKEYAEKLNTLKGKEITLDTLTFSDTDRNHIYFPLSKEAHQFSEVDHDLVHKAKQHFGETKNIREAGYIMHDGRLLDFTGRHQQGNTYKRNEHNENVLSKAGRDYSAGSRAVDHREVYDVVGKGGTEGMHHFMKKTGAIRLYPEQEFGIHVHGTHNKEQLHPIIRHVRGYKHELSVDVDHNHETHSKVFKNPNVDAVHDWITSVKAGKHQSQHNERMEANGSTFRIHKNIPHSTAESILNTSKEKELKGLRTKQGHYYVWDASKATHDQVASHLGHTMKDIEAHGDLLHAVSPIHLKKRWSKFTNDQQFAEPQRRIIYVSKESLRRRNGITREARAKAIQNRGRVQGITRQLVSQGTSVVKHSQTLEGLPKRVKIPGHGEIEARHSDHIRGVAHRYMKEANLPYAPPKKYAKVDPARAKRIAEAYHNMKHDPHHPEVKKAYAQLGKETMAQYEAIKKHGGLKVSFIPHGSPDPYAASPRLATEDIHKNKHMWVYPTDAGFGSSGADTSHHPLLEETNETISGKKARLNDIFRVVHDYFGHAKEGVGFRADGEENAWRSHAAMYTPLARKAMTSETRGQNSWVNYGPHAEHNQKASSEKTVFADQKTGLMPDWTHEEGHHDHDISQHSEEELEYLFEEESDGGIPSNGSTFQFGEDVREIPTRGLKVGMQYLRIAHENLAKGKGSVTPNEPVEVEHNIDTGEHHLVDGYHRYLALRGGSIEAATEQAKKGIFPNIKAKITKVKNHPMGGTEPVDSQHSEKAPHEMRLHEWMKRNPIPKQKKIPQEGTYPVIRTDDNTLHVDTHGYGSHVRFAKNHGIPGERIAGGGWMKDGDYREQEIGDSYRHGEQSRLKERVAHKNHIMAALEAGKKVHPDVLKDHPSISQHAEEKEYPLDHKDNWYSHSDYEKTGAELVHMHPQEYLKKVRPLEIDESSRDNIDDLKRHIQSGKKLDPLSIYHNGKEDGRHRAHAAHELGIKSVPVLLHKHPDSQHAEGLTQEHLDNFTKELKNKHPGLKSLWLNHKPQDNRIHLDDIQVHKEHRKQGIGSSVLKSLTELADKHGHRISLTTATKDDHNGTTSSGRLKKFYGRFGFKKNNDLSVTASMMREPNSQHSEENDSVEVEAYHASHRQIHGLEENHIAAKGKGAFGPGIYFSPHADVAKAWANKSPNGVVHLHKAKLKFNHPLDLTKPLSKKSTEKLSKHLGREIHPESSVAFSLERRHGSVTEGAKAAGFDGVVHWIDRKHGPEKNYIVTHPHHIVSLEHSEHSSQHEEEEQFAEDDLLEKFLSQSLANQIQSAQAQIISLKSSEMKLPELAQEVQQQLRKLDQHLNQGLIHVGYQGAIAGTAEVVEQLENLPTEQKPQQPTGISELPTTPIEGDIPTPPKPPKTPLEALGEEIPPEVRLPDLERAISTLMRPTAMVGADWKETAELVKAGAFAITGDIAQHQSTEVQLALAEAMSEGHSASEFIETVQEKIFEGRGPLADSHLENIFRTNTLRQKSNAKERTLKLDLVSDAFPYRAYNATADARTRPHHKALEHLGLDNTNIYNADDPVFLKYRPVWWYSCRCNHYGVTVVQAANKGVKEAVEWVDRAKQTAEIEGGSFYQYLNTTKPLFFQMVPAVPFDDPSFNDNEAKMK